MTGLLFCRECSEGKHDNCDGTAWSNELDGPAPCTCPDPSHRPSADKDVPVLTVRHVRWAAQECLWQQSGETSVAWMLEGWEYAIQHAQERPSLDDILTLGRIVEPRHNLAGLRKVGVRVGWSVKMPPEQVPAALNQWLDVLPSLDPTEAFRQYEEIHPFRDGNGRSGSILFNWLSKTLHAPIHPPNLWDDPRRGWVGYPDPDKAEPRRDHISVLPPGGSTRMIDLRVLGIDPGPIPGIVVLSYAEHRLVKAEAVQCSASLAPLLVKALLTPDNAGTLVQTEQFVIGRRASRSSTASAGAETRELIGEIRTRWPFTIMRTAAQVKPWATDHRLEVAGLLDATKGMRHARDAARHALYCAVHDAGVPDPLSKGAQR